MKKLLISSLLAGGCLMLAACAGWPQSRRSQATSVMNYLYPDDARHTDAPGIPVLTLPLRVGIAFVPSGEGRYASDDPSGSPSSTLSEQARQDLLKRVADKFRPLPYIGSIQLIPSSYMTPQGGFENLDQIRSMFGVDVIVLVAYDQTQFTNEGYLSMAYWTIVGAYVVNGERNDTQTLVEAVVYDIPSRKLLFRAAGTSRVKAGATLVDLTGKLRENSVRGFGEATGAMITNLSGALDDFKTRVKEAPDEYRIERTAGYRLGGSLDGWFASVLAACALLGLRSRRSCKSADAPFPG